MRTITIPTLAVALTVTALALGQQNPPPKPANPPPVPESKLPPVKPAEQPPLSGSWRVVGGEWDGQKIPDERLRNVWAEIAPPLAGGHCRGVDSMRKGTHFPQ